MSTYEQVVVFDLILALQHIKQATERVVNDDGVLVIALTDEDMAISHRMTDAFAYGYFLGDARDMQVMSACMHVHPEEFEPCSDPECTECNPYQGTMCDRDTREEVRLADIECEAEIREAELDELRQCRANVLETIEAVMRTCDEVPVALEQQLRDLNEQLDFDHSVHCTYGCDYCCG